MRIGIDTHFITSEPATGNHTYTAELVRALLAADDRNAYLLYAEGDHPFYHEFDGISRVSTRPVLSGNGAVRNFISLPRAIAQDPLDVIHFQYILPPFTRIPSVLTIHDLYYLHAPRITRYQQILMRLTLWSARRATRVTTISDYSKQDIMRHAHIDPERITVTPLGVNRRFIPVSDISQLREAQRRLGIPGPYILFVGRTEDPRKNLTTLVRAYAGLVASGQIAERLVIAGRGGPENRELAALIRTFGLEQQVRMLGIVDSADLPSLLSGATAFVYVSSFEGFGLPVLEAMACGAPVITSNVTSLPEVAGNAALMVTPENVEELALTIRRLIGDSDLRGDLRNRGLARAREFSWERTARQYQHIFEAVGRRTGKDT